VKVITGTVIGGKIIVEGEPLTDGSKVTVIAREDEEAFELAPEQEAEIKIEAFPFTRYGTIDGKILTLSKDAVPIEKVGLVYAARVSMVRSTIQVENGKEISLSPGMNVSVEIKTGQRRLIEYFLSPLLQASRESIRER